MNITSKHSNSNFAHFFTFIALLILRKVSICGEWFLFDDAVIMDKMPKAKMVRGRNGKGQNGQRTKWQRTKWSEDEMAKDEIGEVKVAKGPNDKRTIWQEDHVVNGRKDWGLTGEGPFGKRTKWSMAELIKDQMLQDKLAKDKMGEDEVAWYPLYSLNALYISLSVRCPGGWRIFQNWLNKGFITFDLKLLLGICWHSGNQASGWLFWWWCWCEHSMSKSELMVTPRYLDTWHLMLRLMCGHEAHNWIAWGPLVGDTQYFIFVRIEGHAPQLFPFPEIV